MPYQVPQYIDIEDKVVGPLTFRQFIYIAGAAGTAFLAYRFMPFYAAVFVIIPVVVLGLALAFYRINNRSFLTMVDYAVRHFLKPKLFIWHHRERIKKEVKTRKLGQEITPPAGAFSLTPRLSDSKLKDLSWSLDVVQPTSQQNGVRTLDGKVISVPPPPPQEG